MYQKERDKREEVSLWPGNTHVCCGLWSVGLLTAFILAYKKPSEARLELWTTSGENGPKINVKEPEGSLLKCVLARLLVTSYNHYSFKMTECEIQPPVPLLFLSS